MDEVSTGSGSNRVLSHKLIVNRCDPVATAPEEIWGQACDLCDSQISRRYRFMIRAASFATPLFTRTFNLIASRRRLIDELFSPVISDNSLALAPAWDPISTNISLAVTDTLSFPGPQNCRLDTPQDSSMTLSKTLE